MKLEKKWAHRCYIKLELFGMDLCFSLFRQISVECGWRCNSVPCLHWKRFPRLNASFPDKPTKEAGIVKPSILAQLCTDRQEMKSLLSMICVKPV